MDDEAEQARKTRLAAARERLRAALVNLRMAENTAVLNSLHRAYYDRSLVKIQSREARPSAYPRLVVSNIAGNLLGRDLRDRTSCVRGPRFIADEQFCDGAGYVKDRVRKLTSSRRVTLARARPGDREANAGPEPLNGADMPETETMDHQELHGRLAAIETLLLTLTAYTASHVERNGGDLVTFSAAVFVDVENVLQDAAAAAVGTEKEEAAKLALEAHRKLSMQFMPQMNRHRRVEV